MHKKIAYHFTVLPVPLQRHNGPWRGLFLDGNGRIARVMMNAEFSSNSLSKIMIPTVYRDDYMGAIKKLTKVGDCDAYIRMLLRAWEFSSKVYGDDFDRMEHYLNECNAFLPHTEGYMKIIPQ